MNTDWSWTGSLICLYSLDDRSSFRAAVVLMQVRYEFDKHRETPYRHKFYVSDYEMREWNEIVAWCEKNLQPPEAENGRIWFAYPPWIVVRDAQHAAKLKLAWC